VYALQDLTLSWILSKGTGRDRQRKGRRGEAVKVKKRERKG